MQKYEGYSNATVQYTGKEWHIKYLNERHIYATLLGRFKEQYIKI